MPSRSPVLPNRGHQNHRFSVPGEHRTTGLFCHLPGFEAEFSATNVYLNNFFHNYIPFTTPTLGRTLTMSRTYSSQFYIRTLVL